MSRPTTTNYSLKKSNASDPERVSGLAEHWGPVMDANLDAIDAAIATAQSSTGTPVDTDAALTANSDAKVASQKATKAYVDAKSAANVASLTDNSGGAAADGTIAVIRSDTLANVSSDCADAVKELSTKVNAILAALRTAGILV